MAAWLAPLGLGALVEHAGIAAGMQNSNYYVTTGQGRFVLTLFEDIDVTTLDFYLRLMDHLAARGIPCPRVFASADGKRWRSLAGKPAALLSCLPGRAVDVPAVSQLRQVGAMLARLHLAGVDLDSPPPNPCGAAWRQAVGAALLPGLASAEAALLADELAFQAAQAPGELPRGIIHGDLFRDNVLWDAEGQRSGVLDFYFAGEDVLLFDLAVLANDWCGNECGNDTTLRELIAGYTALRPLQSAEIAAWSAMRRAAALRFWLLRLDARQRPRHGEVVTIKDPAHFERMLLRFRLAPEALPR